MISSRVAADALLFGQMALFGWCMGMAYDGLHIFRNTLPHSRRWVDREDLVFWICAGLLFFDWLVRHVRGELRISEILAALAGAAVYQYTISPFLVKSVSLLLRILTKLMKKLFFPACLCIKWLKNHLKRGRISMYGHLKRFGKRKKDRGERKNNGESRV